MPLVPMSPAFDLLQTVIIERGSCNSALLREAARSALSGVEVVIKAIEAMPLDNGDEEEPSGMPTPVQERKDAMAAAQALLLATPEYNEATSGVLKHASDWLTRPPSDMQRVFGGQPIAMRGATPGGCGTILSQNAWLPVLRTRGTKSWCGDHRLVSHGHQVFGDGGEITGSACRASLPHCDAEARYEPVHAGACLWGLSQHQWATGWREAPVSSEWQENTCGWRGVSKKVSGQFRDRPRLKARGNPDTGIDALNPATGDSYTADLQTAQHLLMRAARVPMVCRLM